MRSVAAHNGIKGQPKRDAAPAPLYIEVRLSGQPAMADAEAWIEENVTGRWHCRLIGVVIETDSLTGLSQSAIQVGFQFGLAADLEKFRTRFLGLPPRRQPRKRPPHRRSRPGFWQRLFA